MNTNPLLHRNVAAERAASFSRRTFLRGLGGARVTPGALVWIRVRTCGLKGVMGAWRDPAQVRVV